ncbi:MAG: hypothetical protein ACTH6Y_07670 [Vibrio hibernica]
MAANWYRKNLGDALMVEPNIASLKEQCQSLGGPFVAYYRHESLSGLHCDFIVYFPPESSTLAMLVKAKVCDAPDQHDLSRLI